MPKMKKKVETKIKNESVLSSNVVRQMTNSEDFIEQRKTARLDIPIKVRYKLQTEDQNRTANTKNISAGGCLLIVSEELPLQSEIELDVFLGDGEAEALKLAGTIVRLHKGGKGSFEYGISFSNMGGNARRLFADFCFSKMYEMIGLSAWPTDKRTKA